MNRRGLWIDSAIVFIAFVLRVAWLDVKPAHFDEGVNGWFVDEMTRTGYYHYDPGNFHGPLHFYVLFVSQTLFGRNLWALRMPVAIVSTFCVAAVLAYRRYLPERACRLAALAMAISPGCVFYGRYAIHESWQLLFMLAAMWGLAGMWKEGWRIHLWTAAMGFTGMVLTKETYLIHCIALLLAAPALLLFEKIAPSAPFASGARQWTNRDLDGPILASVLLIFFFYTGCLLDWSSLPGLFQTFALWMNTGIQGAGQAKGWHYFIELIARYEWPALLGGIAVVGLAFRNTNRLARYLAIYGFGTLTAYSLIPYKTPWCVISIAWPFYFVFGYVTDRLLHWLDAWTVGVLTTIVTGCSLLASCLLNFRNYTDEDEPYVYVQTLPDIYKLLDPLHALTSRDSRNYQIAGHIITVDHHPLYWLLGDFTRIDIHDPGETPAGWDGAFLLIDASLAETAEEKLTESYFKEPLRLRGNAGESEVLYLNAATFGFYFPGRKADIRAIAQ